MTTLSDTVVKNSSHTTSSIPVKPNRTPGEAAMPLLKVPSFTMLGIWYDAKCTLAGSAGQRINWEPKPPHDKYYRIFTELCEDICKLSQCNPRVLSILNSKGGAGKTVLTAMLGILYKHATGKNGIMLDANQNNGTLGERLDVSRMGHTLFNDVIKSPILMEHYRPAAEMLPSHAETKALALLSNLDQKIRMDESQMIDVVKRLYNSFDTIISDTGNGTKEPAISGMLAMSSAVAFTAAARTRDSFGPLITTMRFFSENGYQKKVQDSLIVVSATRRNDTAEKFLNWFKEEAQKIVETTGSDTDKEAAAAKLLESLGITENHIYLVPYSAHLANNGAASVQRKLTGMPTLIAYANILKKLMSMDVPDFQTNLDHAKERELLNQDPKDESIFERLERLSRNGESDRNITRMLVEYQENRAING